jgi:hypothetical protein
MSLDCKENSVVVDMVEPHGTALLLLVLGLLVACSVLFSRHIDLYARRRYPKSNCRPTLR